VAGKLEERLKALQARVDAQKKKDDLRKQIAVAKAALRKLNGK
jgi:predicted site-specific integrase-resolvase